MYVIESPGNLELPEELTTAEEADVEATLRRAAAYLGWPHSEAELRIERVASVLGGSCIASVDFVAYLRGTPVLVAKPALY